MKKRFFCLCLIATVVFCIAFAATAVGENVLISDRANVLSNAEEAALSEKLQEILDEFSVEVHIVIVSSLNGDTCAQAANKIYDGEQMGLGANRDGVLLLIAMREREYYLLTNGFGHYAISDGGVAYISKQFEPYLQNDNYAAALMVYAEECHDFIAQAKTGEPYSYEEFSLTWIALSLTIGAVIAFIIVGGMKAKLKTVRFQPMARGYVREGSFAVTNARDVYLYRNVTRTAKQKSSSSGGRSGSSRGGGGGKF